MNLDFSLAHGLNAAVASTDETETRLSAAASAANLRSNDALSRFDIYRASHVRLTSTLFGGGDWRWRLTGASGAVVADCGGYRNEAQCLAAVSALRLEAGFAAIFTETDPEPKRGKDSHAARSL
ncbi:MAG TPA: DUF1508 domain-containing protein [Rhizorhapis sp.]